MAKKVSAAPVSAALVPATALKKSLKKKAAAKPKTARAVHPPASKMVLTAIKELKEQNGSSLQAIMKFITTQYVVHPKSQAGFIKKYILSAVESGALVRTKGAGAAGFFKLPVLPVTKKAAKKSSKKATAAPKAKKAAAKKPVIRKKKSKPKSSKAKKPPAKKTAPKK